MKILIIIFMIILGEICFSMSSTIVLIESKDNVKYELHILLKDLESTKLSRRLIREACNEIGSQYTESELLENKEILKEKIKENLKKHQLDSQISIFKLYRNKRGIFKIN